MAASSFSRKALVVEDDLDFAKLLQVHLKNLGFEEVLYQVEPDEIYDTILNQSIDLLVVDWMMPRIDGITLIKTIRSKNRFLGDQTRILMVSGIEDKKAQDYALKSGADGYLLKTNPPNDTRKFKDRLKEAVERVLAKKAD